MTASARTKSNALRLARCLNCNYDLRGNPPEGECPECGARYHANVLVIPLEDSTTGWIGLIGGIGLSSLFLFSTINAIREGEFISAGVLGIFTTMLAYGTITTVRGVDRHERGLSIRVVATPDRISWVHAGRTRESYRWRHFTRVEFLRRRGDLWVFQLHEGIPGKGRVVTNQVRLHFRATKRDAARIRNELKRRIRAAHISSVRDDE